jgi:LacI family transcriptional regulator
VKKKATTMADVARLAGVTKMTVSRVMTGSAAVAPSTGARVKSAIDALRYRPNELARALRAKTTRSIGVIVPYLSDPFFAICAHAIYSAAKAEGYSVLVSNTDESVETEEIEVRSMLQRNVDGLVIVPSDSSSKYLFHDDFAGFPIVLIDRPLTSPSRFSTATVANRFGSKLAVSHLLGHGHQNITFVGLNPALYTMTERYKGYAAAMQAARLPKNAYLDASRVDVLERYIERLDAHETTALFAGNNLVLRRILSLVRKHRVCIPEELAIIGFDDFDTAELVQPGITVIRQPTSDLGRRAAEQLFEELRAGSGKLEKRNITLPVEMIVRESCGCPYTDSNPRETDGAYKSIETVQ